MYTCKITYLVTVEMPIAPLAVFILFLLDMISAVSKR
jgi:hypothetical protein